MKTKLFKLLLCVSLTIVVVSCENKNTNIIPSSNISSQYVDITGYSGLEIDAAFLAEVSFTDSEEPIEIIANENIHPHVIIEKVSDVLKVRLSNNVNISGPATLKVILKTGIISSFRAAGASEITLTNTLSANTVHINLYGASKMNGSLSVQSLITDLNDASFLDLDGTADNFELKASGASKVSDYNFTCDYLDTKLTGASEARFTVLKEIEITASGASNLFYKGDAVITSQSLTGASAVVKVE